MPTTIGRRTLESTTRWGMCPPQRCVHSRRIRIHSGSVDAAYPTEFIGLSQRDLHVLVSVGFATLGLSAPPTGNKTSRVRRCGRSSGLTLPRTVQKHDRNHEQRLRYDTEHDCLVIAIGDRAHRSGSEIRR